MGEGLERVRRGLREGARLRLLAAETCAEDIAAAAMVIADCLQEGGKVLVFGNGGSAADAQHMAAELVGRFSAERVPLAAIALSSDTSVLTALANDFGFAEVFARQVDALGRPGDVVIAISTSGRSPNVLHAVRRARERGLRTLALTRMGSELASVVDRAVAVPGRDTPRIQELHVAALHLICEAVERGLAGTERGASTDDDGDARPKLVDWDELLELRELWRTRGKTVVWTNGVFDLLHPGHVQALESAKALGDVLIVGVNSDASARELKGPQRPILSLAERLALVAALEAVDRVVVLDAPTPEAALARLRPDVHCKGAEYAGPGGRPIPELEVVRVYGGRVEFTPLTPALSTTEIIRRVRAAGETGGQ